MIERTLVLLKPDTVQRCFMGEIISRFEKAGFKIVGCKMVWIDKDFSKQHYEEHVEKDFYPGLENMITDGPVLAMVLEGVDAIENVRKMVGATEPKASAPGTIRGDYAHISYGHADENKIGVKNLIHASDIPENAKKEVSLWFTEKELHSYKTVHDAHILE
ncbi:MAG: nucleoside-diphosphate kinase [Candidatus Woesearchaeota archaeon]|nr:nucleoside-diphosphate kinase [Candidatus Woesearchaeota archaeon]